MACRHSTLTLTLTLAHHINRVHRSILTVGRDSWVICGTCGFVCQSKSGLLRHSRSCRGPDHQSLLPLPVGNSATSNPVRGLDHFDNNQQATTQPLTRARARSFRQQPTGNHSDPGYESGSDQLSEYDRIDFLSLPTYPTHSARNLHRHTIHRQNASATDLSYVGGYGYESDLRSSPSPNPNPDDLGLPGPSTNDQSPLKHVRMPSHIFPSQLSETNDNSIATDLSATDLSATDLNYVGGYGDESDLRSSPSPNPNPDDLGLPGPSTNDQSLLVRGRLPYHSFPSQLLETNDNSIATDRSAPALNDVGGHGYWSDPSSSSHPNPDDLGLPGPSTNDQSPLKHVRMESHSYLRHLSETNDNSIATDRSAPDLNYVVGHGYESELGSNPNPDDLGLPGPLTNDPSLSVHDRLDSHSFRRQRSETYHHSTAASSLIQQPAEISSQPQRRSLPTVAPPTPHHLADGASVNFGKPIRLIRKNQQSSLLPLMETCLKAACSPHATPDQVKAFLFIPSLVSLDKRELESLRRMDDPSATILRLLEQNPVTHRDFGRQHGDLDNLPASVVRKCTRLIQSNRVSVASKRIESWSKGTTPASLNDPSVVEEVLRLHPAPSPADTLPLLDLADLSLTISDEVLENAVADLPRESGAGIYPWTNELIQLCFNSSPSFKSTIKDFLHLLLNGKLCCKEIWLASKLIMIRKENGKLRPIAIADSWMRLGGRIASKITSSTVDQYLGPQQLGLGKSGGSEILIHAVSTVKDAIVGGADEDLGILALDCTNAFNSLRRSYIAEGLRDACPSLLPYFVWAYEGPTELMADYSTPVARSCTGVRQGDPLGPMLFSVGIARTLRSITDRFPSVTILAYLDDVFVLGNATDSLSAYDALRRNFSPLGLRFNAAKSTLFSFAQCPESPIPVTQMGLSVLGVPVGTPEFVAQQLQQHMVDQTRIVSFLPAFGSPEAFSLLRTSVNTRPVYNVRGLPPADTVTYAEGFDATVSLALAKIVDSDIPLSQDSIEVKNLPARLGGLGMKCVSRIRDSAWVSSWLASLRYIKAHLDRIYLLTGWSQFDPEVIKALDLPSVTQTLGESFAELVDPILSGDTLPSQKELTKAHDQPSLDQLLERLARTRPEAAAWLASSSTSGISSWLFCAHTSNPGLRIDDQDFREALRLRLLMPVHDDPVHIVRRCRSCNRDGVEALHALSCKAASGARKHRHDLVRDALAKFIKAAVPEALVTVETPIPNPLPSKTPLTSDILIQSGHKTFIVDVALVNPSCLSAIRRNRPELGAAGSAAEAKEKKKRNLYREYYGPTIDPAVVPFVLESTGRYGGAAKQFVDKLSGLLPPQPVANTTLQVARQFLSQRIAAIMVKGNAKMIRVSRSKIQILRA